MLTVVLIIAPLVTALLDIAPLTAIPFHSMAKGIKEPISQETMKHSDNVFWVSVSVGENYRIILNCDGNETLVYS